MNLYHEDTASRVLDAAWSAYCSAQSVIDLLEGIGLSVDGAMPGRDSTKNVSALYGALTKSAEAIIHLCGVPVTGSFSDEAYMILAHVPEEDRKPGKIPPRLLSSMKDIADTASKKALTGITPDMRPYEVTLALSGGITVYAASEEDAMSRAGRMDSRELVEAASWDAAAPTDAYGQT